MSKEGQGEDGWLCGYCNLKNRKHAVYCSTCGGHWEEVLALQATTPRGGNRRPSPRYQGAPHHTQNRPASRTRDQGKGPEDSAPHGRGKGRRRSRRGKTGKAAAEETVSPFQSYATPSSWTTSSTPFPPTSNQNATTTVQAAPINEEILAQLQEAYADKEMPQNVKALVEKAQATQRKSVIKGLHSATKELDKASKRLSDAVQERQKHRSQWMQHLEESIQLWQTQLGSYKKRQAELREEAKLAQKDVLAARQSINEQNAQALPAKGPQAAPSLTTQNEVLDLTTDADAEEEELQKKLQSLLEQCAGTVGVGVGFASSRPLKQDDVMLDISSDDGKTASKPKRARSAEPIT